MAKTSVKKKSRGRPRGFSPKKKVKSKPKNIHKRVIPDLIKGQFIIMNDSGEVWTTDIGWETADAKSAGQVKRFESVAKTNRFIDKFWSEEEQLNEGSPSAVKMSEYFSNVWAVGQDGLITSEIVAKHELTGLELTLKQLIKAERSKQSAWVLAIQKELSQVEKSLNKFNVSMEKYGF